MKLEKLSQYLTIGANLGVLIGISFLVIEIRLNTQQAEIDNLGVRRKETVEPMSNYFVSRLQKDFNKGITETLQDVPSAAEDFVNFFERGMNSYLKDMKGLLETTAEGFVGIIDVGIRGAADALVSSSDWVALYGPPALNVAPASGNRSPNCA